MNSLRRYIQGHCRLAAALIATALLVATLVPKGYMPGTANGEFVMRPCDSQGAAAVPNTPAASAHHASSDHHAASDHHGDSDASHGGLEMPCVFSSLSAPALPATDPVVLAIAIAFILAASLRMRQRPVLWRRTYPRPPSQGPPATF